MNVSSTSESEEFSLLVHFLSYSSAIMMSYHGDLSYYVMYAEYEKNILIRLEFKPMNNMKMVKQQGILQNKK